MVHRTFVGYPTAARVQPWTDAEAEDWLLELTGVTSRKDLTQAAGATNRLIVSAPARRAPVGRSRSRSSVVPEAAPAVAVALATPKATVPLSRTATRTRLGQVSDPVKFCLPALNERLAGQQLAHAIRFIEAVLRKGLIVFKLGVTLDPRRRWLDPTMGYSRDPDFHSMIVLLELESGEAVGFVEAGLLLRYLTVAGCRNVGLGGEGIAKSTPGPYYFYIVYRVLPAPPNPLAPELPATDRRNLEVSRS